jgi:hypothetical protein
LGLAFFGLTKEHRLDVFTQIHEIVFHGKGGYDWQTVYNMPIWLRRWTFQKLQDFYNKKNEAEEKAYNKSTNRQTGKVNRPNIKPSYSTKASNK